MTEIDNDRQVTLCPMCPYGVTKGSIVSWDSLLQQHHYIKADQAIQVQIGSGAITGMLPLLRGPEPFNHDT